VHQLNPLTSDRTNQRKLQISRLIRYSESDKPGCFQATV
jgi:hypothetical protein